MRNNQWYGWTPDLPDQRDFNFKRTLGAVVPKVVDLRPALPPVYDQVDLRPALPPVYDQGDIGSCTANAISAALAFDQKKQTGKFSKPSRLFIYFNEREMEGTINEDSGAMIRDGIKSVAQKGVCSETAWPYKVERFIQRPSAACYQTALKHQAVEYHRVSNRVDDMLACLAEGFPFVFGFTVYDGFESDAVAKSGILEMPGSGEKVVGGHAVLAVGYDLGVRRFLVRNSWSAKWGLKGYFWMPFDYLTSADLADDRWVIKSVEA
jgi:C1A family cysteine protease